MENCITYTVQYCECEDTHTCTLLQIWMISSYGLKWYLVNVRDSPRCFRQKYFSISYLQIVYSKNHNPITIVELLASTGIA